MPTSTATHLRQFCRKNSLLQHSSMMRIAGIALRVLIAVWAWLHIVNVLAVIRIALAAVVIVATLVGISTCLAVTRASLVAIWHAGKGEGEARPEPQLKIKVHRRCCARLSWVRGGEQQGASDLSACVSVYL